jgi:uncharacterized protein YyaL (SSP411 family)
MPHARTAIFLPALLAFVAGWAPVAGAVETPLTAVEAAEPLTWVPWSDDVFARAKREHKLVLLDLEAVWCHWCHVMAATTYRDPAVVAVLRQKYLLVRVDQDAHPDLANRYEDYGWPATVVFDGDGRELAKRRGYIAPAGMAAMAQAFVDDPTPGPSVTDGAGAPVAAPHADGPLPAEQRAALLETWRGGYDRAQAGWGTVHKYLDFEGVELALLRSASDVDAAGMARATLDAARALIDPVWGGVYQYSTGGVWNEPHFEKIMEVQAGALRTYSQAYALWHRPSDLASAQAVRRYLHGFLSGPDGAFLTSQDADLVPGEHSAEYFALDDAGRRARGVPRIDAHSYARENGWAIAALVAFSSATGDATALADAERAGAWVLAHRALPGGGFSHDGSDAGGIYLGDTLAMGRAALALYTATGARSWLEVARSAAGFIAVNFQPSQPPAGGQRAGFLTAAARGQALPPLPQRDENVALARFANLLARHTGDAAHRALAAQAFRWLSAPGVAGLRPTAPVLVADAELAAEPLHITVVGPKDDARAKALVTAALAVPVVYKRLEWLDAREGALPNPDVRLPTLAEPAAFLCVDGACSLPAKTPEALAHRVAKAVR